MRKALIMVLCFTLISGVVACNQDETQEKKGKTGVVKVQEKEDDTMDKVSDQKISDQTKSVEKKESDKNTSGTGSKGSQTVISKLSQPNKASESNKPSKPNKPSESNEPSKPSQPEHTHHWIAQTKDVYHEATGHNEKVLVKEAWTETVPVYKTVCLSICNTCGADITNTDIAAHIEKHMLAGEGGSHRTEYRQKQVGTETVEHPAEYITKWVQDSPAWTEKVVIGYKCSCGATK